MNRLSAERYAVDGGTVAFLRLPHARAEQMVQAAVQERYERRELDEYPDVSPVEVDLVAGLLWIGASGFALQHPIGPYDADVYFPAERLCVEVDGRAFHSRRLDDQRDRHMLREFDVKTIRFRGAEVWRDCVACAKFTAAQVGLRRKELRRAA